MVCFISLSTLEKDVEVAKMLKFEKDWDEL